MARFVGIVADPIANNVCYLYIVCVYTALIVLSTCLL